jgi:hypothetical protein
VPTPVYLTGFEWPGVSSIVNTGTGLCASTTASPPVVEAGSARTGSYGMRCNCSGAAKSMRVTVTAGLAVTRVYIRIDTLPSADAGILQLGAGANPCIVRVRTTGAIRATVTGGTTVDSAVLGSGWHRIDAAMDTTGATHTCDLWVDGVHIGQASVGGSAADTDTTLDIGVISAVTCDFSFDDLYVSSTLVDAPIGPGRVVGIFPSGAADHQSITTTEWQTTSDFSAFTNFTGANETTSAPLIDDLTAGTDGIRLNAGAGGQAGNARWSFADPSPDPNVAPIGVRGIVVHQDASSGTNNITERILLSGSTSNIFSGNPAAAWEYRAALFTTDPGGGAWSAQDIRDLQFEIDSTDTNPAVWFGGVVVEVDYPALDSLIIGYDPYLMHSLVR